MLKEIIKIEGMHCPSCSALVESDVTDIKGVISACVSLDDGTLDVEFEETEVSIADIKKVIGDCGFKAL